MGGRSPLSSSSSTQIYLPPPADSNEVSLTWPPHAPHTHAGIHELNTHSPTHHNNGIPCRTAFHPHRRTLPPPSPISYLRWSTRPGIQAVFTNLQTAASEMMAALRKFRPRHFKFHRNRNSRRTDLHTLKLDLFRGASSLLA